MTGEIVEPRTPEKREEYIQHLCTFPLEELRRRQEIVNKARETAHFFYLDGKGSDDERTVQRSKEIMTEHDERAADLIEAVQRVSNRNKPRMAIPRI